MSKGLRKAAIAALIVAIVVYAGAKLYVRSEADAALREAEYALGDLVNLDYEGFSAGLDGSLTLQELTIRPVGVQGEMFIKQLTLAADSLPAALSARRHVAAGRLPDSLSVSFSDLRLNFDSALYRRLNTLSGGFLVGTPLDHLACGEQDRIGAEALSDMGFSYLGANGHAELTRGRDERAALLTVDLQATDIAHVRGEAIVRSPTETLTLEALVDGSALLADTDLRYRDDGYFDARNYYCAAQRDSDVDAFLQAHKEAVDAYLRRHGAVLSDALINGYMRLSDSPGNEVHIAIKPEQPPTLAQLSGMGARALVETLDPRVAVNGEAVEDVAIRWIEPQRSVAETAEGDSQSRSARFYAADPAALPELVGSYARLVTYDGTSYEGLISETAGSRVTLQRRFQGGEMSFGVAVGNIRSAEIYRRSPLPAAMQPQPEPATGEEATETVVVEPAPRTDDPEAGSKAPQSSPDGTAAPPPAQPTDEPTGETSTPADDAGEAASAGGSASNGTANR